MKRLVVVALLFACATKASKPDPSSYGAAIHAAEGKGALLVGERLFALAPPPWKKPAESLDALVAASTKTVKVDGLPRIESEPFDIRVVLLTKLPPGAEKRSGAIVFVTAKGVYVRNTHAMSEGEAAKPLPLDDAKRMLARHADTITVVIVPESGIPLATVTSLLSGLPKEMPVALGAIDR